MARLSFVIEAGVSEPVIVKLQREEGCEDIPLPTRMTEHAAGFDVAAAVPHPTPIAPGEIKLIPCGFSMAIPPGYEAQMRPRSGLSSRKGLTLINTPGTIDADYRGQVQAPLVNLGKETVLIERGMRIAQMVIAPVPRVQLIEVSQLDPTPRGAGGFGHTGH